MDKDFLLFHLKEAREQLEKIIEGLESNAVVKPNDYRVWMEHLYHHLDKSAGGDAALNSFLPGDRKVFKPGINLKKIHLNNN